MHIPEYMLNGNICPVTAVISAGSIGVATYMAIKTKNKPDILRFVVVTSFIFLLQMLNFPVSQGTSGHFLGTTLAIFSLGIPFGIIVMSLIIAIQAIVFADGGILVLGANIFNMALVGAIPSILTYKFIVDKERSLLIVLSSYISIILAAFSCSVMLVINNFSNALGIFYSMISVHALIGLGEILITMVVLKMIGFVYLGKSAKSLKFFIVFSILIVLLILTPFASELPDGLEWVAEKYSILKDKEPLFVSPMPDYSLPFIQNKILSTIFSALMGIFITGFFSFFVGRIFGSKKLFYKNR